MPDADFFTVHDANPNDGIGGGGCLHSGGQVGRDCEGPWINFFRVSTEFNGSPFATICAKHLHEVVETYPFLDPIPGGDVLPVRDTKREVVEPSLPPAEFTGFVGKQG